MDLLLNFGWIALGLVLLYFGAEWLVRGAASLSLKVGLAPLVVGLTVVAFGTSAPELFVSLKANLETPARGGFSLGNVIGSNICNIALILGVAALIRPIKVHPQVLSREMPIMLVVTFAFVAMLWDNTITTVEALILVGTLLLYITSSVKKGLNANDEADVEGMDPEEILAAKNAPFTKVFFYVGLIVLGLVVLAIGADRLVFGGVGIARKFGVSDTVIGLTIIALGTSLPELAASIVASSKKQGDIIVGNVVGSNLFNILAVVGITGVVAPLFSDELERLDIGIMAGLAVIALPIMWSRKKIGRLEGCFFLLIYIGYNALIFVREMS